MNHRLAWIALATAIGLAIALLLFGDRTSAPSGLREHSPGDRDRATALEPIPEQIEEVSSRTPIEADPWVVDRELDLHGVVTGPRDIPIAGAKVTITSTRRHASQFARLQGIDPLLVTTLETDRQGRYSIPLEAGRRYHLAFAASGFGRAWRHDRQAGERVDVSLAARYEIRGVVRLGGAALPPDRANRRVGRGRGRAPRTDRVVVGAAGDDGGRHGSPAARRSPG